LDDIPAEGREFSFHDQAVWIKPAQELRVEFTPEDMQAVARIIPQENSCIIIGRLSGKAKSACDRCLEDVVIEIDESIDTMEEVDAEDPDSRLTMERKGLELDMGDLLWEHFVLALPVHPLCGKNCKGICPTCGANLNSGDCSCRGEELDPRMAALRGLKIAEKK
jgi:uncharacterized protein